jgi:hypothetical protein
MHCANSTSWAVVAGDDPASGVLGLELEHAAAAKVIATAATVIATIRRAGGRPRHRTARMMLIAPDPV